MESWNLKSEILFLLEVSGEIVQDVLDVCDQLREMADFRKQKENADSQILFSKILYSSHKVNIHKFIFVEHFSKL